MNFYIKYTSYVILIIIITIMFILQVSSMPLQQIRERSQLPRQWRRMDGNKRNAFISRGWAAGGMPFSVLYLNQPGQQTGQGPMEINNNLPIQSLQQQQVLAQPVPRRNQTRMLNRKTFRRKSYSVIPQLFVSYGWGPIGRK